MKCDCFNGRTVNGEKEHFLYSFSLIKSPARQIWKEARIKLFRKMTKSVLSHITYYLGDDDNKPNDFNGEMISFTCQLSEI